MATELQGENTISPEAIVSDLPARPTVLVFDSGVGGLSVYDEVRKLLPDLHYIYTFDNEAFPYGEKPEQFIIERVVSIVDAVENNIRCHWSSLPAIPPVRFHSGTACAF